jgi:aqualysin 1
MDQHSSRRRGLSGLPGLAVSVLIAFALTGCADELMNPANGSGIAPTANAISATAAVSAPANKAAIPGQYIVVFSDDVSDVPGLARALAQQAGGTADHVYTSAIKGFAGRFSEQALAGLARNPHVELVEQDQVAMTTDVQSGATWGLDRVDQSALPLDALYSYAGTGAGVHAYIIDSGIRSSHSEFTGRVGYGVTFINDGNGTEDCMGHGTHVAGTVGGTTYGIAKGVTLYPVRVFGCSGGTAYSTIIAAVDWVTKNHVKPAVANMSLGGGYSNTLNTAVQNSIKAGVTYAVAAGNNGNNGFSPDACHYSPASTPEALTVAASTSDDAHAPFSNSGSCVDLYAPGTYISSAWFTSDADTRNASGTSMASPHVAGAAAVYLGLNPSASPATVSAAVVGSATAGKISPKMTNTNNSVLNTTALAAHSGDAPSEGGKGGGNTKTPGSNGKGKKK